jgi:hypothetical protein
MDANVDVGTLVERIRAKDFMVQVDVRGMGVVPVRAITPLLYDSDATVRELAVYCLIETGAAEAGPAVALACLDAQPVTATSAARALRAIASPTLLPVVLTLLPASPLAFVRRELALAVGVWGGPTDIVTLRSLRQDDRDATATEGYVAALGKLGDVAARQEFADVFAGSQGVERKVWLDLAEYVGQPWLLGPLGDVLSDTTPLVMVSENPSAPVRDLRACDLAVRLIAQIGEMSASFDVTWPKNFSDSELEEVRRFVWS